MLKNLQVASDIFFAKPKECAKSLLLELVITLAFFEQIFENLLRRFLGRVAAVPALARNTLRLADCLPNLTRVFALGNELCTSFVAQPAAEHQVIEEYPSIGSAKLIVHEFFEFGEAHYRRCSAVLVTHEAGARACLRRGDDASGV